MMNKEPENNTANSADSVEKNTETQNNFPLGKKLRDKREELGLSVGDVAERLKLMTKQVNALEEGRWDALPSAIFVRGFCRSYAKLLKLDEAEIMADLDLYLPNKNKLLMEVNNNAYAGDAQSSSNAGGIKESNSGGKWIVASLLMLAVVAGIYYFYLNDKKTDNVEEFEALSNEQIISDTEPQNNLMTPARDVIVASSVEIVGQVGQNASAEVANDHKLIIVPKYRSVLKVVDVKGTVLADEVAAANSTYEFPESGAPYSVKIGYAIGSKVTFNGAPVEVQAGIKNKTFEAVIPAPSAEIINE